MRFFPKSSQQQQLWNFLNPLILIMATHSKEPSLTRSVPSLGDPQNPLVVPMGLNFGPTSVSTWFFVGDRKCNTGVPCDELYQSFFQDALSKTVQCNFASRPSEGLSTSAISSFTNPNKTVQLTEAFANYIKSTARMGITAFDSDPGLNFKVMAITVPDHWGVAARRQVELAAELAGYPLDEPDMIISLSLAIHSTYEMDKRTEGRYLFLILEYNKSYLHMMLVQVDGRSCDMKRQAYLPHLGEDELHKAPIKGDAVAPGQEPLSSKSSSDSDNGTIFEEDNEEPAPESTPKNEPTSDHAAIPDKFNADRPVYYNQTAHFKPIIGTLLKFMTLMRKQEAPSPPGEPPALIDSPSDASHPMRGIKYIVVDGEASVPGVRDLRDVLKERFVDEESITVEGRWRDCGAYGAALAAKRML